MGLELTFEKYSHVTSHIDIKKPLYDHIVDPGNLDLVIRQEAVHGNSGLRHDLLLRVYRSGKEIVSLSS